MFSGVKTRLVLSLAVVSLALFLGLSPLFVKPEVVTFQNKNQKHRVTDRSMVDVGRANDNQVITGTESWESDNSGAKSQTLSKSTERAKRASDPVITEAHHDEYESLNINGTMTLREVSAKFNIGVEELVAKIGVSVEYADERLGRLRKSYKFDLNDLRAFVSQKVNK